MRHLEAYAYEVLTARDGETGLRRAALTQPDLILLDVEMPGLDGFETCRRLKANPQIAHIPVIFMTVRDQREDKVEAFRAGAVDYITKPLEAQELLSRVRVHVQLRRTQQELAERNQELVDRIADRTAELEREVERSGAEQADKGRLLEDQAQLLQLVHSQSRQIQRLTSGWVAEQRGGELGLQRAFKERVARRLALTHTLLEEARRVVAAHATHTPELSDGLTHLDSALELLRPTLSAGGELAEIEPAEDATVDVLERLSVREREVLRMLAKGRSAKEIAAELGGARTTVTTYRARIMEKFAVDDFSSLIRIAVRHGL